MKKKNKSIFKKLVFVFLCIVLFLSLFSFSKDYLGGGSEKIVSIVIEKGASTKEISSSLKESGVISHPLFFRVISKLKGYDGKYLEGNFNLNDSMSYNDILKKLSSSPDSIDSVKIIIPEGYEFRQIVDLLEENKLIDRKKFCDLAQNHDFDYEFLKTVPKRENRLEGYLFPDTYIFDSSSTEILILQTMLARFDEIVTDEYKIRANELGMTLDEVITLASVIEREAKGDADREYVSSVFHNRLQSRTHPYLESCATVQYILKERKPVLSTKDTSIDSPYNTYINPGLPIGPIASPGEKSIKAALYPAKTDYLFFALDSSGTHRFATTYEEHLKNISK